MKTHFFRILLCSICISAMLAGRVNAQEGGGSTIEVDTTFNNAMNHVFVNLDKSKIPFGLLRDYAMEFTNLENFNGAALTDSNYVDHKIFWEIVTTLALARTTSAAYSALPNPNTINNNWFASRQPGRVSLCGIFYQYGYLDPNAANNGTITVTNGQLFDKYVNGVWQNPYLQGNVIAFAPSTNTYRGKSFNINLPANLWLTNSSSLVSSIQVDAGDGLGYRTLAAGIDLPVSYADTGMKVLNFKINLANSTVLQSHSLLHITPDPLASIGSNGGWAPAMNNDFSLSSMPYVYHVNTSTLYNGAPGVGVVTVQLASGHTTLTNPFIVAEGFDAGIYTSPESLTGSQSYTDWVLDIKLTSFYTLLRSNYDVIWIDFKNGTDDIHRNALVVEDVIRWANANKTGPNKNVVMGLSMGGLCARYALKTMENGGETHQTGLFITQGTPHQGVVVPLSLQCMEIHANSLYMRAGVAAGIYDLVRIFAPTLPDATGLLSMSNTPAALQMLITHLNSSYQIDNTVHNAWQTELTNLGYPTQGNIRNVAISNGSECGQTQVLTQNSSIIYVNGKLNTRILGDVIMQVATAFGVTSPAFLTNQPALLLGVLPGRNTIALNYAANAASSGYQAYAGKITYTKTILWLIPVTLTITNRTFNSPAGVLPYETYGGDYFAMPSYKSFGSSGWFGKYNITLNIAPSFGFGPTPSVLDIGKGLVTLTQSDYAAPYAETSPPAPNSPFANYITAFTPLGPNVPNNNEGHLTYETRNSNWLVKELNAQLPNLADCSTLCQTYAISGDANDCNSVKTYSVPSFSNVSYSWTTSGNLQINSGQGTSTVQIQPLAGTNGQQGTLKVDMSITNQPDCGPQSVTKTISIGVEPLVVSTTVDRSPQANNYQYVTSTATLLPNTTSSNYTWYLEQGGQPTNVIAYGITLNHYPIAPGTTIFYQCQAVTPCGTSVDREYAYNTNSGGYAMTSQSVTVYPNPSNNVMTVTNNNIPVTGDAAGNPNGTVPQSYRIVVYNDKGQILKSAKNENGNASVNIGTADIPDGNYFLHIMQGSNVIEKQVMVRH
ncbi:MAG: Protein of unknown function precursor [Mucilaginibacter sp.]|nr:Protein of unknown function precursor [Mucilaginibacter sp.]